MARTPAPGTRGRILTVAARLFYDHGVRAVGTNRVIAEAGTGKNLLYTHFPTKADLVVAYLQRVVELRTERTRAAVDRVPDDPRERLVAIVEEVAATTQDPEFRGCAFRNYLAEFPDDGDPGTADDPTPAGVALAYLAATRADIVRLVARLDPAPADPDRLVDELWLLVDGLYMQAAYRDRTDPRPARGAEIAVGLARRLVDPS